MAKSADAFRTISEVADWLGVPTHVLRFWESKFPQVKPVKRAGGRRYYRPSDMLLLAGIRVLLHDDGMTIRGVQKILREKGVKHVVAMADREVAGSEEDAAPEKSSTASEAATPLRPDPDFIFDFPNKRASPVAETPATEKPATEKPATEEPAPETPAEPDVDDQMPLFTPEREEQPELVPEPEPEPAPVETILEGTDTPSPVPADPPTLPGPSPVGGPSLGPLLEQIRTASPSVADEMRQVLATQKDRLEALRDRLRTEPDGSGSDTDG